MVSSEDPTRVLPTVPAPPGAPPPDGASLTPHEPLPGGPGGPLDPPLPPTGGPGGGGGWDDGPGEPERDRNTLLAVIAGTLVVIALLLGFFLLQGDDDDGLVAESTPTVVESTPAPTPEPSTPAVGPDDSTEDDAPEAGNDDGSESAGDTGSSGGATIGGDDAPSDDTQPADDGPLLTPGSVTKLKVKQGETVSFRVLSDSDEEVHVHGYDQKVDVRAGDEKTITLTADLTGIFEIELEGSATQIGELTVEP
jgi:hypothetical protein